MPLSVILDLPTDVEDKLRRESPDLAAEVKEAYALELFRRGKLTHYELSRVLGLDHLETDAWLQQLRVFEGSLTMADLEGDRQTLDRVMNQGPLMIAVADSSPLVALINIGHPCAAWPL